MVYLGSTSLGVYCGGLCIFLLYNCSHKRIRDTQKPDVNIVTILSLVTVATCILNFVANFLWLLWGWIQKQNPFSLTVFFAVNTPLMQMIYFIILIIREVYIIRMVLQRSIEIVTCPETTAGTYQNLNEGEPISRSTTCYVQPYDEYYT